MDVTTVDEIDVVLYGDSKVSRVAVVWDGTADVDCGEDCGGLQRVDVAHVLSDDRHSHNIYRDPSGEWSEISSWCRDWLDVHGDAPSAELAAAIDSTFL